jgi:hypothetical protein
MSEGVGGDTRVAGAENRVYPVEPADRRASGPGIALVAACSRVIEVGAASALQQVSAGGRLVTQLARGAGHQRLRQHRIAGAHSGISGHVRIHRLGADSQFAVRQLLDVPQGQPADVDQMVGLLDVEFHQVKQIGAAADELRARSGHGSDGSLCARGSLVGERPHSGPPTAMARMAATIFG